MVGMRKAAEYYGFQVDRQGRCICPFHNDRRPSMKIYPHNRGYYCFSCGSGGDVIKFVSRLYGLDNGSAAKKIIEDFSLPIRTDNLSYREKRERDIKIRQRRELEDFKTQAGKILMEYRKRLCEAVRRPQGQHFAEAMQQLSIVEYWLSCLDECPQELKKDRKVVEKIGAIERRLLEWSPDVAERAAVPG